MKKFFLGITVCISVMSILTLGGCSDFGFNPIGRWKFVLDELYIENSLADSLDIEKESDDSVISNMYIVFEKSGTGYFDNNGIKSQYFTYEYTQDTITMTFEPTAYQPESFTTSYKVIDDGKKIVYSDDMEFLDDEGETVKGYESFTYRR